MSKTIDEKVVEMRFDNKNFESNVSNTLSSLDKLKQKLNLSGASKGLENVQSAANKCNLSVLSGAVETMRVKFSALEVMSVTALTNITNSAVNAGKRIVSALTIDPVKDGFAEYETQINAVQTILANTQKENTSIDQVNAALDTLNTYADKTIYNFTEMTRNIGTFTAAGVGLQTSVDSIQGIANLAAVSGSSSLQASTAMYQLSQAIAAGKVQLMDWNSVVNAGMGGQVFQDALVRTSENLQTGAKAAIEAKGSFRESLQEGWLTTEVLTETLKQFSLNVETAEDYENAMKSLVDQGYTEEEAKNIADMAKTAMEAATKVKTFSQLIDTLKEALGSGWTQSWRIIIGDFEEAKELWTEVSDVLSNAINDSAQARNDILQGWSDLGGRTALIDSLKNAFEGVLSVVKPIKEAFSEIFPSVTSEQLFALTEGLKNLTEKLKVSDETAAKIKSTFKGLFAVAHILAQAFLAVVKGVASLFGIVGDLGGGILDVTARFGDWLTKLDEAVDKADIFNSAIQGMVGFIKNVINEITEFAKVIGDKLNFHPLELLEKILDNISARFSNLADVGSKFADSVGGSKILQAFQSLWEGVKKIGTAIASALGNIMSNLINGIGSGNFNGFLDLFNTAAFGGIAVAITKFFKNLGESVESLGGVKDILDGVKDCLSAWQQQLQAGTLLKIASAIGILALSLLVISSIDSNKLLTSLGAITGLFADLMAAMSIMSKMDTTSLKGVIRSVGIMIGISVSILILASALKKIGSLDTDSLTKGLIGVMVLMSSLVGSLKLLATDSKKAVKGAFQMIALAIAVKILASTCKSLSELSWEELAKGLSGMGAILLEFVGFQALMSKIDTKGMIKSALSLVVIAAAMEIFADVCSKFGDMDWDQLAKGAAALTVVLLEFVGFQALMQLIDTSGMVKSVLSLIVVAAAMEIFADVCSKFGKMEWEELGKGCAALTVVLLEFVGFQALMSLINADSMVKSVLSLVLVAAAMEIFADVCSKFGKMEWEELGKAGVAMAGILALSAGFAYLAGLTNSIIKAAAGLLIMGVALRIFTPVLTTLGNMSWGEIAKGLIALAGAFAVLGVAGLLLQPLIPAILGLAGALALIGVGIMAAGIGVTLLATGIAALAIALSSGATAIVAGLAVIISGIANLIPLVIQKIGEGIIAFCNVIAESAPAIGEAIKAVVLTTIDVLVECIPALVEGLFALLSQVLDAMVEYGPQIVDKLVTIFIGILNTLTERAPEFIDSIVDFLLAIINGISSRMSDLIEAGVNLISSVIQGVVDALEPLVQNVIKPLIDIILDAISSLASALSIVIGSITSLIQQLGNSISQVLLSIAAVIATAGSAISQVLNSIGWVFETVFNGISDVVTSVGDSISQVLESLGGVFKSVFNGISDVVTSVGESIKSVLDGIAGVIDSIGNAALNAGNGFKSLAEGVEIITNLNIVDMGASMGAVALALGDIASKSSGLAEAGAGMQQIADGTNMSATAFSSMVVGITMVTSLLVAIGPTANTAMSTLVSAVTSSASCFTSMSTAASTAMASVVVSLSSIGTGVAAFGSGISGLTGAMNSVMNSMVSVVANASGQMSAAVSRMMMTVAVIIRSQGASMATAFNSVIAMMLNALTSRANMFRSSGMFLMLNFKMGLTSGLNGVTSAIQSALTNCVGAIRSFQSSFAGAGKDLGQGLVSGINTKQQAAYDAGYALGQKAVQGEKDGQASNSPSKLTIKAGKWLGEGLVIGMNRMGKAVYQSGKSMGEQAFDSISNALTGVDALISNIDNVHPIVAPVVDMSNMQYRAMDFQLNANLDALVSQPVTSLASIMSEAQAKIDASNMAVVDAVSGLRNDLNSMYEADDQEIALYVDSRKLASSIASPMNRQLNILSRRGEGL